MTGIEFSSGTLSINACFLQWLPQALYKQPNGYPFQSRYHDHYHFHPFRHIQFPLRHADWVHCISTSVDDEIWWVINRSHTIYFQYPPSLSPTVSLQAPGIACPALAVVWPPLQYQWPRLAPETTLRGGSILLSAKIWQTGIACWEQHPRKLWLRSHGVPNL